MIKRNLQNANNTPIAKRRKKEGFFDVSEDTPSEMIEEINVKQEVATDVRTERALQVSRKKIIVAALLVTVLVVGTVSYVIMSMMRDDTVYGLPDDMLNAESVPYDPVLMIPDWETDIFTYQKYLNTNPDRIAYRVWESTTYLYPETYSKGGKGLLFIVKYLDTVKNGDHETLNTMYTDDYFKNEENKMHSAFPMQKIFNVSVQLRSDIQEEEDKVLSKSYDVWYFVLRYNILDNDGYFRNDIDHIYSRPQLVKVLTDRNGNGKIHKIWDIPGYTADIE